MRKPAILGIMLTLAALTLSGCAVGKAVEGTLHCIPFPDGGCNLDWMK